jgi:pimeloyl-ACP methyl ester carboxylesterase
MSKILGRPNLLSTITEMFRAGAELFSLYTPMYYALRAISPKRKGDGKPVLIIPGFALHDHTTRHLRGFLEDIGHQPYGWKNGLHLQVNDKTITHLEKKIEDILQQHPDEKITLIGHSLGGIIARELAREMPDHIQQVITLGSPFGGLAHENSNVIGLREAIQILSPDLDGILASNDLMSQIASPPPVPTTSIYTEWDGFVNWEGCLNPETDHTENIGVQASHVGLVVNPLAFYVIADRLAQEEGEWSHFEMNNTLMSFLINHKIEGYDLPDHDPSDKPHTPIFKRRPPKP